MFQQTAVTIALTVESKKRKKLMMRKNYNAYGLWNMICLILTIVHTVKCALMKIHVKYITSFKLVHAILSKYITKLQFKSVKTMKTPSMI